MHFLFPHPSFFSPFSSFITLAAHGHSSENVFLMTRTSLCDLNLNLLLLMLQERQKSFLLLSPAELSFFSEKLEHVGSDWWVVCPSTLST